MNQINFEGQVAIVTGAGGGLGKHYAVELAKRGAKVVVNDLGGAFDGKGSGHAMADQVCQEIRSAGGEAVPNYDSVGTAAGGESIVQTAVNAFGGVDIVINNAGHLRNAPFGEIPQGDLDSLIEVHLKGAFYVSQPAFKVMKKKGYGRFLFAASGAGFFGNPEQAAYAAAKSGMLGLMNVVSIEGAAHGIKANVLLPSAASRMIEAMKPEHKAHYEHIFKDLEPLVRNAIDPKFVMPLVVYLVSRQCESTHSVYTASWGRFARVMLGVGQGWAGPRDTPATVEEIAAHWKEIASVEQCSELGQLNDEYAQLAQRFATAQG
jgi:NAD(P)-dependent dehydrogenase (short-subunit alcohol dehydrogenase family)